MKNPENLIIIGSGPAGLAAAIYASRAGLKPLVIEGPVPGGQPTLTTEVENYPGFSKGILGSELMKEMRKQAIKFGARFVTENVASIKTNDKGDTLVRIKGVTLYNKAVLIATGAMAVWLGLESEERLKGKGVSACAICDGFFFKEKIVGVVGGGDSALGEALFLTKFAKKVYLIHRRDSFRASKIMQKRVFENSKIEIVSNAKVEEVLGKDKVEGVKLKILDKDSNLTNQDPASNTQHPASSIQHLALQGLFIAISHKPSTDFLKGSGVELDAKGYIVTSARAALENAKFLINLISKKLSIEQLDQLGISNFDLDYKSMTSVNGIFAAGDCVDYIYRQVGTAVGMGIAAELEIEKYLIK